MGSVFCIQYYEFPSPHAGSLAIMQQCQALSRQGKTVRLIYAKHWRGPTWTDEKIFTHYGISDRFTLVGLPVPGGRFAESFFYAMVCFYLLFNRAKETVVYTRKLQIAAIATFLQWNTVLEFHTHYKHTLKEKLTIWPYQLFLRPARLLKIIVISQVLKKTIRQDNRFEAIDVIPSGANRPTSQERRIARSPDYALEVGYTGSLFRVKGIELILDLARQLPAVRFHLVGGTPEEVADWSAKAQRAGLSNLVFYGYVSHHHISAYLNSFDVCLLPTSMPRQYSSQYAIELSGYSSPLKLFDYMAHGKPIICSDRSEFREILTDSTALFCRPDHLSDWVSAIRRLHNEAERHRMGRAAQRDFQQQYSWDKRAERVFDFVKTNDLNGSGLDRSGLAGSGLDGSGLDGHILLKTGSTKRSAL